VQSLAEYGTDVAMFERKSDPVLPAKPWLMRIAYSALMAGAIIIVSLGLGTVGYWYFCDLGWIDSVLNAAMILTGMGPVDHIETDAGKIFATIYSIFSGVVFLGTTGILVAPWAHRFLHRFHADLDDDKQ
jgi:hypothetical protein